MEGGVNGRPPNRSLVLRGLQLPAPRNAKPEYRERASILPATRIRLLLARAGNAESAGLRGDERAEDHHAGGDAVREYVKWCGCKVFFGGRHGNRWEYCERHIGRQKDRTQIEILRALRKFGPLAEANLEAQVGGRGRSGFGQALGRLAAKGYVAKVHGGGRVITYAGVAYLFQKEPSKNRDVARK